jgi:short-subunit dehydrogenase
MTQKVMIIGATSAIAQEVAKLCAARGDALYLVGRSEEKLEELVADLGGAVRGYQRADLDMLESSEGLIASGVEALDGLDVALVAHGFLGNQQRAEHELDHAHAIIRTNFVSAVALLIPLANHFEAAGRGTIAVMTSVAGDRGRPRNYTYGASKGALSRYLQGVRSRLHGRGVRVYDLRLGPVDTPMTTDHPKNALFADKQDVARGILDALGGRMSIVYVPSYWRPIMSVVRALPEFIFQRFAFLSGR